MFGHSAIAQTPIAAVPQAAAGVYTLTAEAGAYSVSGSAAALKALRLVSAASGAFALAGTAAALRRGYPLAAASGSFTLAGSAASLKSLRRLAAATGAFATAGTAAALERGLRLAADSGNFSWTGEAAGLVYTPYTPPQVFTLVAESGAFAIVGSPAILIGPSSAAIATGGSRRRRLSVPYFEPAAPLPARAPRRLSCQPGRFEVVGGNAQLERGYGAEILLLLLAA